MILVQHSLSSTLCCYFELLLCFYYDESDKTTSVALSNTSDNNNRTRTTSFVMTTSNFNAIGSTPFRCDAEVATGKGEEEGKKIQATLNVTIVDPGT